MQILNPFHHFKALIDVGENWKEEAVRQARIIFYNHGIDYNAEVRIII